MVYKCRTSYLMYKIIFPWTELSIDEVMHKGIIILLFLKIVLMLIYECTLLHLFYTSIISETMENKQ